VHSVCIAFLAHIQVRYIIAGLFTTPAATATCKIMRNSNVLHTVYCAHILALYYFLCASSLTSYAPAGTQPPP
jgi:hypothetical protein